ncbi:exo-alpha-sialidase [Actinoplanes sp. NBRC 101535]|uniref:exo-alpha-sialidase n=1 Tax=Actinoplanes sp. NBRC 101535 TaxID=3032196 RepID=UPI002556B0BC|nr:exo-alpha-sialidase [Actinoplanes sp. NBRC 101535]
MRKLFRVVAAVSAAVLVVAVAPRPAQAAVDIIHKITQEEDPFEARFPDVVKLADGRLMAVWHRSTEHAGVESTIQLSFWSDGNGWSAPANAFADPSVVDGWDTRDPKLGRMNDGSVVLTFFTAGKVYYSVWKPGWTRFTAPEQLTYPGAPTGIASHGAVLALADGGGQTDQVLIPFYQDGAAGGAFFMRATWRATVAPRLLVAGFHKIIANDNPVGRRYSEPSFVQIGDTVVTAVRSENLDTANPSYRHASPVIIARWNAYAATPSYTFQSFTGVLASSHHLLKTSSGKVLFTYGNRASDGVRPTVGMMIDNPAGTWSGTPVPLYDSGLYDQANPSTVEPADGWFWTLGYNAKTRAQSSNGGTLWVIRSQTEDY